MFHVVFHILLYVNFRALITSLGEERASFSAIVYLQLCGFCLEGFLFILVLGIGCVISLWHSHIIILNNWPLFVNLIM